MATKAIQKNPLTDGPLARGILLFSIPLVLSNLLQVLFNMSDVAVVGRFAGAEALGAVGSTTTLVTLFTGFLIGAGSGVNIVTARFLGAREDAEVRETVHTSAILCGIIGLVLLVIGQLTARPLLALLDTKDTLIDGAVLYLRIYFLGMPAMAMYNFGNGVLSAAGDTKRPLYILSAGGALNIALNLFTVIVCGLGVAGVAIASAVSQCLSAGLILYTLGRSRESYALRREALRIEPRKARLILSLSLPAGFQNAIFAIANLFIQAGVNSFDATMVAGNAAAANADSLVYDVMAAFYTACSSFMSQNYGAGKRSRVLRSYLVGLGYAFGIGLAMGLGLVLAGPAFLALFTAEAAVVQAGMMRLRVMGLSYAISAFMDCSIAASRGLGESLAPTVIVILGSCVFRVVWVYTVFAHFHTILALYLVYACSWTITAIAEIAFFVRAYRRHMGGMTGVPTAAG